MSTNTIPSSSSSSSDSLHNRVKYLQDRVKALEISLRLSLPETQYHSGEWTPCGGSTLNTFNVMSTVEAPFALDAGSPILSGPSPMKSDLIYQPLPNTALDPDNGMDTPCLSGPGHLEGRNFNLEPRLEFINSFSSELSMTPSIDDASSQTWSSHTLPWSPDASSSNGSLSRDYFPWANRHAQDHHVEPSSGDIQNHAQNSCDVYLSSFCGGTDLHSPTPSWSEKRSDYTSLIGTSCQCCWDGGCLSVLTVDRSEVMKHLQLHHGVKSGGDKDKISCHWDGCEKEIQKESISRHIVTVHLSDKTKCGGCGKQYTRLDSKLRHLKRSKRKDCRESEPHDSRVKRLRLSWP
ncbi:uncharacterized protein HD556DRAFT_1308058 [Suillus plorans]|uniref:C2H2-type domain-containing protein n=1 Tax=Suillus plorans TaxID=116603 RepID=A0A9P7AS44_9AGAM|nr:uncharacterized protein HD556DRAFT_1308058 [Suillus plorans]KAG1794339.1 hypothetical protein HD556DRAFT_1308058 [Suillus plorans]